MSVSLYGSGNTVIQVVNATNSVAASTTGTPYVASNLTATITPLSSSSKILVIINATCVYTQLSAAAFGMGLQINRGATAIYTDTNNSDGGYIGSYANYIGSVRAKTPLIYLDSPATTSATTYTLYFSANNGTALISGSSSISSITLMEIAYA